MSALGEIRARLDELRHDGAKRALCATDEVGGLLAVADAVLALHVNRFNDKWGREHDTDQGYGGWCNDCGHFTATVCPTVEAVTEALGGTE